MEDVDLNKIRGGKPLAHVRREDRAIHDEDWIRAFLGRAPFGVIGTASEGQPFLVTRNFAYDDQARAIYFHGAREGRTHDNALANDRVCFSVSEMGRLLPAERAAEVGVEFAGVIAFGHISLVTDPAEAKRGLQLLLDKYFAHLKPDEDYEATTDDDLKDVAVYRIDISAWSGKQSKVPEDYPGAFLYREN
jgi:nitroimidazol reductase NimA-like FMN-containing flavoprotein (pyridoxamine 5'-phosphate oxidase superfamily)